MAGVSWKSTSGWNVPPGAVEGGVDDDGSPIYVGRAWHINSWMPAKVIPRRRVAYVAYGGAEHEKSSYEFLCEKRYIWQSCTGYSIPPNAVEGGRDSNGEILFIGRANHGRSRTVGKVHRSHGCLYIPYGGREVRYDRFEILVEV